MPERCRCTEQKHGRRCCPSTKILIGIACILLAVLILLIFAPEWVVALLVAGLLLMLGFFLLGMRR